MAKFGTRSLNGQQYFYSEGSSGESAAIGIDTSNGHFHIVLSPTPNADPTGTPIIDIETATNGNIDITPNGSGSVIISAITVQSGSVDNATLGAFTPSSVNATSYALNGVPVNLGNAVLGWTSVAGGSQTIAVQNGYISANGGGVVAFTLPASAAVGDVFRIAGDATSGMGWTLAQAAGQYIQLGASKTTVGVGGSLASTVTSDAIECVCTVGGASTGWSVISSMGNITVV